MRDYAVFACLAAVACAGATVPGDSAPVSGSTQECTLEGEAYAGADSAAVCAIFARALAEAGVGDSLRIELSATSPTLASAVVRGEAGAVLVDLQFTVSDATLAPATWEKFAGTVAAEVARAASR